MQVRNPRATASRRAKATAVVACLAPLIVAGLGAGGAAGPDSESRRPAGHPDEGLPSSSAPIRAYSADPESPLNALHAMLFIAERVPEEVGAALPGERKAQGAEDDAKFFVKNWYFRKRAGVPEDRRAFGGDVRVSPVGGYTAEEQDQLRGLLAKIDTPEKVGTFAELSSPLARLMLQWDLVSVWWRLEKAGKADEATLVAMAKAIAALAQEKAALAALAPGEGDLVDRFAAGGSPGDRRSPYLPASLFAAGGDSPWVEVDRKSTILFHGATSFRSSRVFVNAGTAEKGKALVEAAARAAEAKAKPEPAEIGSETALVLTLVGITPGLEPVATPVIDEVRIRAQVGPERAEDTSSHDGLNQWLYYRSRTGSLVEPANEPFRFIPDTAQSLFLEYGTAKWTTFAAQCVLCHRTSNDGGQTPSGIRSLGRVSNPRVAADPRARGRQAESDFAPVVERLKQRLGAAAAASR
jgi:hypothetical protein